MTTRIMPSVSVRARILSSSATTIAVMMSRPTQRLTSGQNSRMRLMSGVEAPIITPAP